MRLLYLVFFVLILIFVAAVYLVFVSFSEHREYSVGSLDDFILTPAELSMLSKKCKDHPTFVYSSADGPKPTIVTLSCTITKDQFEEQMMSNGFNYVGGIYKKKDAQVQAIESSLSDTVTSIAYIGNN